MPANPRFDLTGRTVVVTGGGNLGMVWFPRLAERPALSQVDGTWPNLVPGLLSAMQNNPTLAQQVGGLLGSYFQPNPPAVYRTDWTALPSTFTDAATAITGVPAAKLDTTQQDQARAASLLASYRNGEPNATGGQHPDTAAQDRASNDENVASGDFW